MSWSDTKLNKKLVAAGLSAGLLAGGAAGVILGTNGVSEAAVAQDDPTTTVPADSAGEDSRESRMRQFLVDTLTPLVEDGTITEDQMGKVIEALEAARPQGGPGGKGGKGGQGGQGGQHGGGHRGEALSTAATALGMEKDELRDELRSGKTLAEVAAEKGVDVQVVIDALVAEAKAHLDQKVADGDMTQEEADERLADLTERITDRVNDGGGSHGEEGSKED